VTSREARVRVRGRSVRRAIVRFAPVAFACAALVTVLTALVLTMQSDDRLEVRALVVGQRLAITIEELDASVQAIYRHGGVTELAVTDSALDVTPNALRGDLVDVVVVAATPVIQVVGRDADPVRAAEHANAVATALTATLNDAGGIGTFALVESADPARADTPASVPVLFFAVLAGLTSLAIAYAALILWVRPMFTLEELAEVSTSPAVMLIDRSPDGAQRLASALSATTPDWILVDLNSYESARLASLVSEADSDLDITVSSLGQAAVVRREHPDASVALIVAAGSGQGAVRNAESAVGERLRATVMLDEPGTS
jgi:capsular polysaccharide biosynthesis protein